MDKQKITDLTMDFYDRYKKAQRKSVELTAKKLLCADAFKHSKSKKEDEDISKEYRSIKQQMDSNDSYMKHITVKFIESIEEVEVHHAPSSDK